VDKLIKLLSDIRPDVDFAAESKLVTDGILDSFDIVAIVSEINDAYSVSIGVTELMPENFDSAEAIFALINTKLSS
jgi:acyl carrier protein